jgi:hypothetical protein
MPTGENISNITVVQVVTKFSDVFIPLVSKCKSYALLLLEKKGKEVLSSLYFSHYDLPNLQGI